MRSHEHAVVALDAAFCAWCIPGLFSLSMVKGTSALTVAKFRESVTIGNAAFGLGSAFLPRESLDTFYRKAHRLERALRYMKKDHVPNKRPLGRDVMGAQAQELLFSKFPDGSSEYEAIKTIVRSCPQLASLISKKCLRLYRPFCELGGNIGFGVHLVLQGNNEAPGSRSLLIQGDLAKLPQPFHDVVTDLNVSIRKGFEIESLWRIWTDLRRKIGRRENLEVTESTVAAANNAKPTDADMQFADGGAVHRNKIPRGLGFGLTRHQEWLAVVEKLAPTRKEPFASSDLGKLSADSSVRNDWLTYVTRVRFLDHNGLRGNGRRYWRIGRIID